MPDCIYPVFLCLGVLIFIPGQSSAQSPLPDGVYLVTDAFVGEPSQKEEDQALIRYNYRIVDSTAQSFRILQVDPNQWVPLHLDREPERVLQPDDRSNLFLTLDNRAGRRLKRMTRRHVGARVAIVIGGEAVTMHKIRVPIKGRRLQITRCTDDACSYLFVELRDNVKQ